MIVFDFVIIGEDDCGRRVFLIGADNLSGVIGVVNIVLMGDSDQGRFDAISGKIKIIADAFLLGIGVDFEIVFFGDIFDVFIRSGSGEDDIGVSGLVED